VAGRTMQAGVSTLIPTLTDGMVVLRPLTQDDVPEITQGCQDEAIARWTTVPQPYLTEHAQAFVTEHGPGPNWWQTPTWAITVGGGPWCGTIDLRLDGQGGAEVGFMVAPGSRNRGLATRSLRLTCRWGFAAQDLQVIRWWARVGNDASRSVARSVGFHVHDEILRRALVHRGERVDAWYGDMLPVDAADTPRRPTWQQQDLTAREREVLNHLATGRTNREIAIELGITENTVKNHVRSILEKLPARSRIEAVVIGVQQGLTHLPN